MTSPAQSSSTAAEPVPILVRDFLFPDTFAGLSALHEREIHIWRHHCVAEGADLAGMQSLLSADELERARRFRFDIDRNEFIFSRGTLRTLLGAYLALPPDQLRFEYSSYARPILAGLTAETRMDFNVSHSGGITLWAFAMRRKIGIDVEKVRTNFSTMEIAERFFSESERHSLHELAAEQRHEAFFRCWTRKESFIKALGEGLSHPLNQFDVTLAPDAPPRLLATRPDTNDAMRWVMWDVTMPPGYVAALTAGLI